MKRKCGKGITCAAFGRFCAPVVPRRPCGCLLVLELVRAELNRVFEEPGELEVVRALARDLQICFAFHAVFSVPSERTEAVELLARERSWRRADRSFTCRDGRPFRNWRHLLHVLSRRLQLTRAMPLLRQKAYNEASESGNHGKTITTRHRKRRESLCPIRA